MTTNTVGAICNEIGTWPHEGVKDALKNLYKFTCNYPPEVLTDVQTVDRLSLYLSLRESTDERVQAALASAL